MANKGAFKKGDSRINRQGRPKASKTGQDEVRTWITYLIEKNWHKVESAIDAMTDSQAAHFIFQYMIKYKISTPQDEIMRLTSEQLDQVISELKKRYHEH